VAPGPDGPRVDGGLRAPPWAAVVARVRRCVRIRSITDGFVMQATRRITLWQLGHARRSTSKICWSSVAHRRVASVSASRGADTIVAARALPPRRTKRLSTARRNASVNRAVSCTGHATKFPSGRNPPSVTSRCRCGHRRSGSRESGSRERRADARLRRGPSPFRGATCCFDATLVWRGPNPGFSPRVRIGLSSVLRRALW